MTRLWRRALCLVGRHDYGPVAVVTGGVLSVVKTCVCGRTDGVVSSVAANRDARRASAKRVRKQKRAEARRRAA